MGEAFVDEGFDIYLKGVSEHFRKTRDYLSKELA